VVFEVGINEIGNGMEGIGNVPGCPGEISFGGRRNGSQTGKVTGNVNGHWVLPGDGQ
jgi:hypothetical protein